MGLGSWECGGGWCAEVGRGFVEGGEEKEAGDGTEEAVEDEVVCEEGYT